jgi:hypothetical protein
MPGKSKHGKGRRTQYKNRARQPQTAGTVNSALATPAGTAQGAVKTAAPVMVRPAAPSKAPGYSPATKAEYPFFTSELKRITVLTAILLVILVAFNFIIK